MFVIEVLPLRRGISVESLSYYAATEFKVGTLLTIPLRNKETQAVVISSKPVSAAKTALKTATFSLRRLPQQPYSALLPSSLLDTAKAVSERVPASIGAILYAMLPPEVRSGEHMYPQCAAYVGTEESTPCILTDAREDRFIAYRSHIRQSFAHRGSVLFVVPTSVEVEEAAEKLKSGIENRVVTLSGSQGKKQQQGAYAAFEDLRQAKLIIATPSYAFLDRHDITTIIVESSGSSHYKQRTRPYLDARETLKMYAKLTKRSIILGDAVPSPEDEEARRSERYSTFDEHTTRLQLGGSIVAAKHKALQEDEKFSLFTEELLEAIPRTLAQRGHIYLYASRRGLAPIVVCYDCGHIFRCPDSGAPYSLLRTMRGGEEERWFFCSTSGRRERAADVCPSCGSWRLREQGIGVQLVYDQTKKAFPDAPLFLFDHTTATTHGKAKRIAHDFYEARAGILIGTSMALPYLTEPIDVTGVISYEAMRSIPTWRADEIIFSQLIALREKTAKDCIVQLRSEEDELLTLASRGLIDQFYDGELALRQSLGYPPFFVFILLSFSGTKTEVDSIEENVRGALKGREISFYSPMEAHSEKSIRYGLLRIEKSAYPDAALIASLRGLPPYIKIEVNPERII